MKLAAHLIRVLLLAITLVAGAAAWLFAMEPERVRAFDEGWTARHSSIPLARAEELAREAARDPQDTLPRLDRFLARHGSSRRGDRTFVAVRLARRARVEALLGCGRVDEGLDAAASFAAEDPRDLATRLWAGRLISVNRPDDARGPGLLARAFGELPELGETTRALFDARQAAGDAAGALDVLLAHLAVSPRAMLSMEGLEKPWDLWWTSGDDAFDSSRRASATAAVTPLYIAMTFDLPAGTDRVRIDPPGGSRLAFDRTIFAVVTEAGPTQLDLSTLELTLRAVAFDGMTLETTGAADPWISFALPETWRDVPMQVRLVLASGRGPAWMEAALGRATDAEFETAVQRLMGSGASMVVDPAAGAARARAVRQRGLARITDQPGASNAEDGDR